jgi:hypothetical protein
MNASPKDIAHLVEDKVSGIDFFQGATCFAINGIAQVVNIVISSYGDRNEVVVAFDETAKFKVGSQLSE